MRLVTWPDICPFFVENFGPYPVTIGGTVFCGYCGRSSYDHKWRKRHPMRRMP